ncbi:hypothetical protein [Armatimonas sp.]|uniref:hypothetical protein n=1 Tax=Armatimonas sp. TaxID=1872638 RepID=UPI00286B2A1F|nr:hypothetical protein [Armatimonas sp.]
MIKIKITIKYNNREVSILPGCPGNGRIIKLGNEFITDRISNAEIFCISIIDDSKSINYKNYTFTLFYDKKSPKYNKNIKIPFKKMFKLDNNSKYDYVYIKLTSDLDKSREYAIHIPIGSR